jgi:hypothetical protein
VLYKEQQQEEDNEFIILKIYKFEIDKAIEDLKEHKKLNQYYEPDYKLDCAILAAELGPQDI